MSGDVGDSGFYIKNNNLNYGPFKTKDIAEFFNLIAFCNPRSFDLEEDSKSRISFDENPRNSIHPNKMLSNNSTFFIWWYDMFEFPLTLELVMKIAKESGAMGYLSFIDWLLNGCVVDGRSVYYLIN